MQLARHSLYVFLLAVGVVSCQNEKDFVGSWKPFEVKIWYNYHHDSLLIDLPSKKFYFNQHDKETLALMTPSYKDSLLEMLSTSYLILQDNGNFEMEDDHAFFTQALSDIDWHNKQ